MAKPIKLITRYERIGIYHTQNTFKRDEFHHYSIGLFRIPKDSTLKDAAAILIDKVGDKNYEQGKLQGKYELQNSIKDLLNISQQETHF